VRTASLTFPLWKASVPRKEAPRWGSRAGQRVSPSFHREATSKLPPLRKSPPPKDRKAHHLNRRKAREIGSLPSQELVKVLGCVPCWQTLDLAHRSKVPPPQDTPGTGGEVRVPILTPPPFAPVLDFHRGRPEGSCEVSDPAAGSPTATLLRLLLPPAMRYWPNSAFAEAGQWKCDKGEPSTTPKNPCSSATCLLWPLSQRHR